MASTARLPWQKKRDGRARGRQNACGPKRGHASRLTRRRGPRGVPLGQWAAGGGAGLKKVPATIFPSDSSTPPDAAKMVAGTFLPPRIGTSRTAVRAFIQNVHHFRDATLRDRSAPADHVVVFDEAQRAWDARQLASFMKRKKGLPGFTQTEPELLIGAMERHADWAVVVCLVGGGQEINTGEAGISAWLDGVRTLFPGWDIFISPHLTDSEYAATGALARLTESRAKREAKTVPATIFTSDVSTPRKRCLPPFPPRKRWLTPFPALAPSPPTPPSTSPPRCGPSARNTSPASSKPCSTAKPILAAISSPPFASSIQSCSRGACGRPGGGSARSGGARSGRGWWLPRRPSGSSPTRSTYFPLTRLRLLACRIVSPMISSPR